MNIRYPSGARLGFLAVLFSTFLFSAKSVLIKMTYTHDIKPLTLMTLRVLICLPLLTCIAVAAAGRAKSTGAPPLRSVDWLFVFVLGTTGYYFASLLDLIGLQHLSVGMERMILYLHPTFVVLIGALLFKEKIEKRLIPPYILCYGGIGLVFANNISLQGHSVYFGAFMVAGSAFFFAFFLIGSSRLVKRMGPVRLATYGMLASCLAILIHFSVRCPLSNLIVPAPVYFLALLMSVFTGIIPVYAMIYGLKLVTPARAAVIGSTGPILTIALGWLLLKETLNAAQLLGIGIALAGGLKLALDQK
jgi:drug/metabolite transporter (DMT)-like permease